MVFHTKSNPIRTSQYPEKEPVEIIIKDVKQPKAKRVVSKFRVVKKKSDVKKTEPRPESKPVEKPSVKVEVFPVEKPKLKLKPELKPEPEKPVELDVAGLTSPEGFNPVLDEPVKKSESHLPTKEEILEHAQQLYMKDNARFQDLLGDNLPERVELQEEGYLQRARLDLMRQEGGKSDPMIKDYIDNLRTQLEEVGFTIVPF